MHKDDAGVLVILLPLAFAIACYLGWSLYRGRIRVRSITSLRRKNPIMFWWDFVFLALFDGILWFVGVMGAKAQGWL